MIRSYDPQAIIGNTVAEVLRQPSFQLAPFKCKGGGVYLLYYTGDHPLYVRISSAGPRSPIYAGRTTKNLGGRLRKHFKSIGEVWDLQVPDFQCRALHLPPGWELMVEDILIRKLSPLWNQPQFQGFGNNARGKNRLKGAASQWDILHPGRKDALQLERPPEARAALQAQLAAEAAKNGPDDPIGEMFGTPSREN